MSEYCKNCYELAEQLSRKTQECEELKPKCLGNRNDYLCERQVTKRYRKALEEIENIVSGDYETLDPLAKKQIFNIINKAKGKAND